MQRMLGRNGVVAVGAAALMISNALLSHQAWADPCGMVPPVTITVDKPIIRVGAQKTYVAYKDGVETMVLRPGFKGKVDEFGMLIPFPTAPAIRKVDENTFPHIAAAVDPPEVVAYVNQRRRWRGRASGNAPTAAAADDMEGAAEKSLSYDEVRVVNREAVGMYDVAVLAAGSPRALKRWMDSHSFRYPEGMDEVVQDYVTKRWVFVAVKTQVGKKDGVNPRPGMKDVDSKLPNGATFNGHVQAMGFRFKSKELVVPMRLSAFNPGKLRNILYVLTDEPVRINSIPKRYVVRQVSGRDLYRNITGKLPVRVIGGELSDLSQWERQNLESRRNAEPHNGRAKDLFASDLLAISKKRLANPEEEREKELLAIGERLGIRGQHVDALHRDVLAKSRARASERALRGLSRMTLTVIDGEFQRETIAKENLTFARHVMPSRRNKAEFYDSVRMGPGGQKAGKRVLGSLVAPERNERDLGLGIGVGLAALGLVLFGFGRMRRVAGIAAIVLGLTVGVGVGTAEAGTQRADLIAQLGDGKKAQAAVDALVKMHGYSAVDDLLDAVADEPKLEARGWAIAALGEIGGERADRGLKAIHESGAYEMLVRTWAAAARVQVAQTTEELAALAPLANQFPAIQKPLGERISALASVGNAREMEATFQLMMQVPGVAQQLAPVVASARPSVLVKVMLSGSNNTYRQWGAAYLGTAAQSQGNDAVAAATIAGLKFTKGADQTPWNGGALYIPGIQWEKEHARAVTERLLRWLLWADLKGDQNSANQIENNLWNGALMNAGAYGRPQGRGIVNWLALWRQAEGRGAVARILKEQGAQRERRFRPLLRK